MNEKLFLADLKKNKFEFLGVKQKEGCKPCNHEFETLSGKGDILIQKTCDGYQITPKEAEIDLEEIANELGGEYKDLFAIAEISGTKVILFENGRMQIDVDNKAKAKSVYSKIVGL